MKKEQNKTKLSTCCNAVVTTASEPEKMLGVADFYCSKCGKTQYVEKKFDWEEYLLSMRHSDQRHIKIIAKYFTTRHLSYSSKDEIAVVLKRHYRAASQIAKFETAKIKKAFEYCQDKYSNIDWSLETIVKVLSSVQF